MGGENPKEEEKKENKKNKDEEKPKDKEKKEQDKNKEEEKSNDKEKKEKESGEKKDKEKKKEKTPKNPDEKKKIKDPAGLRAKLEKLDVKMDALKAKKDEIMRQLHELENGTKNTIEGGEVKASGN